MTGICGLDGRTESQVETMLSQMAVRGSHSHVVTRGKEGMTIGLCGRSTTPFTIESKDSVIAVDGGFFNGKSLTETIVPALSNNLETLYASPGAFSFVSLHGGKVVAGRDPLGQKPLYYGTDRQGRYAFASLRRALTAVGVKDSRPVPPGELITVSNGEVSVSRSNALRQLAETRVDEDEASRQLGEFLLEAVSKMVPASAALAFSGGLDSSLVAEGMRRNGMDPHLITVGVGDSPEVIHASEVAEELGLNHTSRVLMESEVVHAVPVVAETIEATDPTIVSVALPFLFACQEVRDMKFETIIAGQLSDELFGGYARFEQLALAGRLDEVNDEVWRSVLAASANDFEPGDKVAVASRLEVKCPFAYLPLVNYALSLPAILKVRTVGGIVIRKYILRKLAREWGLPSRVVNRPKKAFQYSSGVHKVLMKEARRKSLPIAELTSSPPL